MLTLFAVAALSFAQPSDAVEARFSDEYRACMDATGGVTVDMLNCIAAETDRQDDALNAAYRRVRADMDADSREELRDVQRAWIAARDATCNSRGMDAGRGSYSGVAYNDCILSQTAERVIWLESQEP